MQLQSPRPEPLTPFKGSSQDARLMRRDGGLKPQLGMPLWSDSPCPSNRSQIISLFLLLFHCGRGATRRSTWRRHVGRFQESRHSIPEQGHRRKWVSLRMHRGLLLHNKFIHAFMYISNKDLTQPAERAREAQAEMILTGTRCYNQKCINKSEKKMQHIKLGRVVTRAWVLHAEERTRRGLSAKKRAFIMKNGRERRREEWWVEVWACHVSQWGDLKDRWEWLKVVQVSRTSEDETDECWGIH